MSQKTKLKRPASQRWAIGIFAFLTIAFVIFLIDVIKGRSGASPMKYLPEIVELSFCPLALFALLFGCRQKWAYYVTSVLLASYALNLVYRSLVSVYYVFYKGSSVSISWFNLVERDKPFVEEQDIPMILTPVAAGLLIWLFLRFTIGRQSRGYYKFPNLGIADPSIEVKTQANLTEVSIEALTNDLKHADDLSVTLTQKSGGYVGGFILFIFYTNIMLRKKNIVDITPLSYLVGNILELIGLIPLFMVYLALRNRMIIRAWFFGKKWVASFIAGLVSLFLVSFVIMVVENILSRIK